MSDQSHAPAHPSPLHLQAMESNLPSPFPKMDPMEEALPITNSSTSPPSSIPGYPNAAGFPPGSPPSSEPSVSRSNSVSRPTASTGSSTTVSRSSSISRAAAQVSQFRFTPQDTPFEDDDGALSRGSSRPHSAWGSPVVSPNEGPTGSWSVLSNKQAWSPITDIRLVAGPTRQPTRRRAL